MASSRRATTRIALVAADRHRARVVSSGRYHAWPSVRSARPRAANQPPPVLLPPGRPLGPVVLPSARRLWQAIRPAHPANTRWTAPTAPWRP